MKRLLLGLAAVAIAAPAAAAETFVHLVSDVEGVAFGPRDGVRELAGTTIVRTRRTRQSLARRFGARFDEEVADAAERCAAALAARRATEPQSSLSVAAQENNTL